MNLSTVDQPKSPVILVVQNRPANLATNSDILNYFSKVYVSLFDVTEILLWIQQNQPDLIILDLPWLEITEAELITALRLDWLTRNIPILILSNICTNWSDIVPDLDYNACLCKPYLTSELEKLVCSLVSTPACLAYAL